MRQSAAALKHRLAGTALILGPLLFIIVDAWLFTADDPVAPSALGLASMIVWVPAVLGLYHLFRGQGEGWGLAAGGTALVGILGVVAIITNGLATRVVANNAPGSEQVTQAAQAAYGQVMMIGPFGVLFPLGLLLFAIGMMRHRMVSPAVGALLGAGAFLYPLGRIPSAVWIVLASDVLLALGFCWVGFRILTVPGFWTHPTPALEPRPELTLAPTP